MRDVNEILFRCSSLGYLLTNPRTKTETLSETTKTHCIDVFGSWYYGRREEIFNKYLTKGNAVEEDSITLVSVLTKKMLRKNEQWFYNDYVSGTPDCLPSPDEVEDIKSAWSWHTFARGRKEINPMHEAQLQGYMWLTGARVGRIRLCLVNATPELIIGEFRKLSYVNLSDDDYQLAKKQTEINMIFDAALFKKHYPDYQFVNENREFDIPAEERMHTFTVQRDEEMINKIESRVTECRQWIKTNLMR